ncbi:MAG: hypothetical protein IT179_19040 [Acidobacteria bacterium]|nr:hypothetical protein [Acidobacteriota bacterium]
MFMAPAGVTGDQLIVFGALAATLVLFVWNRWPFDLAAVRRLAIPPARPQGMLGHPR